MVDVRKPKSSPTQSALNLWAVILIIWAIYRANFRLPEWFDEFIAKPTVFILPVYWYVKRYEKTNFLKAIDLRFDQLATDVGIGFGVGAIFAVSALLANFMKYGALSLFHNTPDITMSAIGMIALVSLATGISEEILSRGFVLKRLYNESKNIFTSSFIASILFFFLHVPILFTMTRLSGNMLIMFMVTDLILSLVNSVIFIQRKSLVPVILIHTLYNIALLTLV